MQRDYTVYTDKCELLESWGLVQVQEGEENYCRHKLDRARRARHARAGGISSTPTDSDSQGRDTCPRAAPGAPQCRTVTAYTCPLAYGQAHTQAEGQALTEGGRGGESGRVGIREGESAWSEGERPA